MCIPPIVGVKCRKEVDRATPGRAESNKRQMVIEKRDRRAPLYLVNPILLLDRYSRVPNRLQVFSVYIFFYVQTLLS